MSQRLERLAATAATAASLATLVTPQIQSWYVAGPLWLTAAILGVRWYFGSREADVEPASTVLGDINVEHKPALQPAPAPQPSGEPKQFPEATESKKLPAAAVAKSPAASVRGTTSKRTAPSIEQGWLNALQAAAAAEQKRLPKGVIRLAWHRRGQDLQIYAMNQTDKAIRDFRLFVHDIKWYLESVKNFVEVEELHPLEKFKEMELLTGSRQITDIRPIYPGTPLPFACLISDGDHLKVYGRTADGHYEYRQINRDGTWQVTFRCEALGGKSQLQYFEFEWKRPEAPKPLCDSI